MNCATWLFINSPLVIARFRAASLTRGERGHDRVLLTSQQNIKAMQYLASELPDKYSSHLSTRIVRMSMMLYDNGYAREGRLGLDLAYKIGKPSLEIVERFPLHKRILTQLVGLRAAVFVAYWYRQIIPTKYRSLLYSGTQDAG